MKLLQGEITEKILNELKPGVDEKIYENALVIELLEKGLACEQQKQHDVFYRGNRIGKLIPDLVVAGAVIVDTKVVESSMKGMSHR